MLSVKNLSVHRSGIHILSNINWTIQQKQHWTILGCNGAGKSTLIQVLLAYLPATKGEIKLLGNLYGTTDWREVRANIGLVSQNFAKRVPHQESVEQIIISGQTGTNGIRRDPTPEERAGISTWLEQLGLANRHQQPWRLLSQGERQKTLIARALHAKPRILILDEPCAGLDPIARHELLQRMDAITHRPDAPTLIHITHHIEEIHPAITHVLGLADGKIAAKGPRADIVQNKTLQSIYQAPIKLHTSASGHQFMHVIGES